MPAIRRLSPTYCFLGLLVMLGLSGCQSTGGNPRVHTSRNNHGHTSGETEQFDPDDRGTANAKELRPVSNKGTVELLREANETFERAVQDDERGEKDESAKEYRHMLSLLEQADIDPSSLYSTRKEFADDLAREVHSERRHHNGDVPAPLIKIPAPVPDAVIAQIERIQNDYPDSFQVALDRGQRYMPEIRQKLHAAGLPEELVFIAMIESHFNEKIVSRAGAGGMWQFMPETGRLHNLRQDGYIDERYDWQASTDAAIDYFTNLRDMFNGNWPLAIASYNGGEGGIQRACAAAGGEDEFFHLINADPATNMIKQETKDYFPKFLAYWLVTSHAEHFGFATHAPQIEATEDVPVQGSYAFDDLERSMGLDAGTLARLNPTLVRQITPPIGENRLRVPQGSSEKLASALQSVPQYGQGVRAHKVRKGETLAAIADKYGFSVDQLKRENKLKTAKVKTGETIKLPFAVPMLAKGGSDDVEPIVAAAKQEKTKRGQAPVTITYTVKSGDSYVRIAEKNGVSLNDLLAQNKLSKKSQAKSGQKLKITKVSDTSDDDAPVKLAKKEADPAPKETTTQHTVAKGEYLTAIAKKYGISVDDLAAWNGLKSDSPLREGQKLSIKKAADSKAKEAPAARKTTIKVAAGDTANKIATKNGVALKDLLAWNSLTDKSVLHEGQEIVILANGGQKAASSEAESKEPMQLASAAPLKSAKSAKANTKTVKPPAPTVHTVAPGQTPTAIAKKYNVAVPDLFKWNKWSKDHVLKPGEKVMVEKK